MANSWFRLWTDMVNDPKWRTIARVSKQKVGDVIAVYVHMMTMATNATERGRAEGFNDEDVATALDIDTEQVTAIREAMQGRVLDGDRLTGWEKRQPAREDGSAERAKAYRERKKAESEHSKTQPNATERQIREEEIREEIKPKAKSKTTAPAAPTFDPLPDLLAHGVTQEIAADWLALRKSKRAAVTPTALKTIVAEAAKAGITVEQALAICCTRGWAGFEADWVLKDQRAGPPPDPAKAHLSKAGQATARNMEAWLERKRQEQEQSHG